MGPEEYKLITSSLKKMVDVAKIHWFVQTYADRIEQRKKKWNEKLKGGGDMKHTRHGLGSTKLL